MLLQLAIAVFLLLAPASLAGSFNASTFLVTMYASDPLSNSLDLVSGLSGSVLQGFTQYNYNSDVTFGRYHAKNLTSGTQGDETAAFVDIGTAADFDNQSPDDCETVGGNQYFASLHVAEGKVVIVNTCGQGNACPQTFRPVPGLAEALQNPVSLATVRPQVNHMYILLITSGGATRALFKILVVHAPEDGSRVTFRYGVLNYTETGIVSCCGPNNETTCQAAPRNLPLEQGPAGPRGTWTPALPPTPSPAPSDYDAAPLVAGTVVGSLAGAAAVSAIIFWLWQPRKASPAGTPLM